MVEAPKTAIYGTLYFGSPEEPTNLLWLAVYNLSSLNLNKCKALKGRNVYLFPDLSKGGTAFELWSKKADQIQSQLKGTKFTVSNLLERLAPKQDKEKGKDIADYLIRQDWRLFRKTNLKKQHPNPELLKTNVFSEATTLSIDMVIDSKRDEKSQEEQLLNWENDVTELEIYFTSMNLANPPMKLNKCSTITNYPLFIESHFAIIKANKSRMLFLPYLTRLKEIKKVIKQKHVKLT